jgi:hypothetical protein
MIRRRGHFSGGWKGLLQRGRKLLEMAGPCASSGAFVERWVVPYRHLKGTCIRAISGTPFASWWRWVPSDETLSGELPSADALDVTPAMSHQAYGDTKLSQVDAKTGLCRQ